MKHAKGIIEMYQRLVPDTSQTLQAVASRALAEIEDAELQAARIASLEAAKAEALGLIRTLALLESKDGSRTYPSKAACEAAREWLEKYGS